MQRQGAKDAGEKGRSVADSKPTVLILSGFLGAGKTTLLLKLIEHLRSQHGPDYRIAIIENEIGSVSVDGDYLEEGGYSVTNLLSGCACCTLLGYLPSAFDELREGLDPQFIVFEATGLARPENICDVLRRYCGLEPRTCTLVDAPAWAETYECLEGLVTGQVEPADIVVVTKTDLADEEVIVQVEADVSELNPGCPTVRVNLAEDVDSVLLERIAGL